MQPMGLQPISNNWRESKEDKMTDHTCPITPAVWWSTRRAGRKLAEWHSNNETVKPWPVVEHMDKFDFDPWEQFKVDPMRFQRPTADQNKAGAKWDKTQIVYNSHLTISHIPLEAYEYVVNGKPAIE